MTKTTIKEKEIEIKFNNKTIIRIPINKIIFKQWKPNTKKVKRRKQIACCLQQKKMFNKTTTKIHKITSKNVLFCTFVGNSFKEILKIVQKRNSRTLFFVFKKIYDCSNASDKHDHIIVRRNISI